MENENNGCFTLFLSLIFRLFILALFLVSLAAAPELLLPLMIFLIIKYLLASD